MVFCSDNFWCSRPMRTSSRPAAVWDSDIRKKQMKTWANNECTASPAEETIMPEIPQICAVSWWRVCGALNADNWRFFLIKVTRDLHRWTRLWKRPVRPNSKLFLYTYVWHCRMTKGVAMTSFFPSIFQSEVPGDFQWPPRVLYNYQLFILDDRWINFFYVLCFIYI